MEPVLTFAIFGALGGLTRVLVSYLKNNNYNKGESIDKKMLSLYTLILLVIGAFTGIVLSYSKPLSFLAGYAGIDLIDGFYKSFMKKKISSK